MEAISHQPQVRYLKHELLTSTRPALSLEIPVLLGPTTYSGWRPLLEKLSLAMEAAVLKRGYLAPLLGSPFEDEPLGAE